jgi:ribosomal protein S18 acetylase RimI-like enzyme
MKNVEICLADIKDVGGIITVLDSTLGSDFGAGEGNFENGAEYLFSRAIEDKNEQVYVAKENGEVVGFVYFINKPPSNGTAILEMLAVRKEKQRQGIGSHLIRAASDMFIAHEKERGIELRTLHLTTGTHNEGAQKIYTHAFFQKVAEIKGFVGDGNVEIVMLRKVSDKPSKDIYVSD